jgi:hypothetical protein
VSAVLQRDDLADADVREVVGIVRAATEHHLERRIRASSLFETPRVG